MSNAFELAAIYRSHFSLFLQRTFQALHPNTPYLGNWHIEAICHALERCARGEIRRLIITVPPRSLKSICASVAFPAWVLARNPSASFITVSYASLLANELANQTRNVMSQPWYCRAFPRTRISPLKNTEGHIKTTRGGHRFATSVTGTLTGMGADFIIVDDPLKASEEPSEAALANVTEWMRASLFTRLNNKLTGVVVVIMQRLHEEDPVGYLLEQGGWEHLNLPAIAESETMIPIGPEQFHHRRVGDVLHPAREPRSVLDELETQLGPYAFAAQYQQNPAPAGGGIVQWHWFQLFDVPPVRQPGDWFVQSWDPAATISEHASFSVCTTWLCRNDCYYLLDVFRQRLEYPELERYVIQLAANWSADMVLIEKNTGSIPLLQSLQRYAKLNLKPLSPVADKATRMRAESALIAARRVFLPRNAPWLAEYQSEMVQFPKGKFNDQVDSTSQFLYWARSYGPNHPRSRAVQSRFIPIYRPRVLSPLYRR